VPLLELVQERRFDARNKRHRAKLLKDDSLLELVTGNPGASVRLSMLADAQERYRRVAAVQHGDGVGGTAVRGECAPARRRGGAVAASRRERLGLYSVVADSIRWF
jgi:hypothetical protein